MDAIYHRLNAFEASVNASIGRMEQKLDATQVQDLLAQAKQLAAELKKVDIARLLAIEQRLNTAIAELRAQVAAYDERINQNRILALAGL